MTTTTEWTEKELLELAAEYPGIVIGYDPWQCEYLAAQLYRQGVDMLPVQHRITGPVADRKWDILIDVPFPKSKHSGETIYD